MTRIIKKYPNRRLYDTETSSYITLAEIKQFVLDYHDFRVQDARSGEDLTHSILLQIILEEESGGVPMFSSEMLSNIIRYYGHAMQGLMGNYLERSILAFHEAQRKFQDQAQKVVGGEFVKMGPQVWQQFLSTQGPGLQNMVGEYLEKSASSVLGMQEELRKQATQLFSAFPMGARGAAAPHGTDESVTEPRRAKASRKPTGKSGKRGADKKSK